MASAAVASPDSDSNLDDDARRRLEYLETLDLDALRDVEIEILSRHPERRFEAPAAVSVIGNERIRRSSMTRLPDLLRYVPGLHVNKIDANKWAIASRNISSRFSNTMLVLMDGRTICKSIREAESPERASEHLVAIANGAGGNDNITAVTIFC